MKNIIYNMKTYKNFINNLFKKNPKIKFWNNSQKRSEDWKLNGIRHREDGPTYQSWYDNGQKESEYWFLNGKYHRENGPADQYWYENGQIIIESWYLKGNRHREDGPAYQKWFKNGEIEFEFWYLNGKGYRKEEWIDELKKIGSIHYEEQKMLFDFEKYNL